MKIRRLISYILLLALFVGAADFAVPASADGNPGYYVEGSVTGDTLVVRVYLQNCEAYSGRLALSYDTELLRLVEGGSFENTVRQSQYANVTPEQNAESVLLGKGHAMFAWFSQSYDGIDALSGRKEIASLEFTLLDGVTEADFKRGTIGLYYVNNTMVYGWGCSAAVITTDLNGYVNTAADSAYLCGVEYKYPNCDYVPPVLYNVSVKVTDTAGKPLGATISLDGGDTRTDSDGRAVFNLYDDVHTYRISASGYETKSGYFIVDGKDESFTVQLRSNQELAEAGAKSLKIGYTAGDTPASVTANISLPVTCEYGTVSWESSDSAVISPSGVVYQGYDDTDVTLTAFVAVGFATVTRDFNITVKSRYTAEEKNAMLVSRDKEALDIVYAPGDYAESVTVKLTLPEKCENGSTVSWESSNSDIIDESGNVTRLEHDAEVILTAYIIRNTAVETKEFTVVVKARKPSPTVTPVPQATEAPGESAPPRETSLPSVTPKPTETPRANVPEYYTGMSDFEIVASVINALQIGYAYDDDENNVKSNLTLPLIGAEDTVISWESTHPTVITPYGGVIRQAEVTEVTLTATVTHGSVSDTSVFKVTVKASAQIPVNPENGQEEEIAVRNSGGVPVSGAPELENQGTEATPAPAAETEKNENTAPDNTSGRKKFEDIDGVPWAQTAINTLTERGVISGTSDTTYSPQNNIRRADFVMLLVKLLKLDAEITDTFEDVTPDRYYYTELSQAKSLGIVAGVDETHFNPEGYITRQDMMTMTYRALSKLGLDNMEADDLGGFADARDISDYASESVRKLVGGGYIHGDEGGRINPKKLTTRAETAVFLYNLGI